MGKITDIITINAQNILEFKSRDKKQKWVTEEILFFMGEHRKHKRYTDDSIYKTIQKSIISKIRIAKTIGVNTNAAKERNYNISTTRTFSISTKS